MHVLIIGGRLQGIEIAYLAKKAGFHTTLADKDVNAPAAGIADVFICVDVMDADAARGLFLDADIVFPALEDAHALGRLLAYGKETGTPVVYDERCYGISSSKARSNALFKELGLPVPKEYPACGFPVIVKPDGMSGSLGVRRVETPEELKEILKNYEYVPVIQEYVSGPGFSMEVIGNGNASVCLPITEVVCGDDYDCIGINAPAALSSGLAEQFWQTGKALADSLKINGIFDIEALEHNGKLKLLEIDARFPSQTPISVYHATGINMVEMLAQRSVLHEKTRDKACLYRQILVEKGEVRIVGEHVIAGCGRLWLQHGFFGADEAVTDFCPGASGWAAILIITAGTLDEAAEKWGACIRNIKSEVAGCPD